MSIKDEVQKFGFSEDEVIATNRPHVQWLRGTKAGQWEAPAKDWEPYLGDHFKTEAVDHGGKEVLAYTPPLLTICPIVYTKTWHTKVQENGFDREVFLGAKFTENPYGGRSYSRFKIFGFIKEFLEIGHMSPCFLTVSGTNSIYLEASLTGKVNAAAAKNAGLPVFTPHYQVVSRLAIENDTKLPPCALWLPLASYKKVTLTQSYATPPIATWHNDPDMISVKERREALYVGTEVLALCRGVWEEAQEWKARTIAGPVAEPEDAEVIAKPELPPYVQAPVQSPFDGIPEPEVPGNYDEGAFDF